MWWWYIITLRKADLSVGTNASTSWNPDCWWVFRSLFGKFGPLNNLVPRAFPLKNGWGRVGTRLSAVIVIVFFLPYPVKFYFIYLVQSLARSHWPLWRNDVCTAAPLPSKEKWIGERDCLLLSVFVLFVCLFVFISYFEKGCQKKCKRQSRKVLWVVLSSLLSQKTWKNGRRCHGHMFVSAYGIWKATKVGSTTN